MTRLRDVAIVGAGPAGSALALRLASRGVDVVLLDRARFPRDKLCGEFLSPDALQDLHALGVLPDVLAHRPARLDRFVLTSRRLGSATVPLPWPAIGLTRLALDATLCAAARARGADVREGACATSVRREPAGTMLMELREDADAAPGPIRARVVVDAAGRLGAFAGRPVAGPAAPPDMHLHVGLKRRYRATSSDGIPEGVEIHAFGGGYLGLAQVEGGLVSACALVSAESLRRDGSPEALLDRAAQENPALRRRWDALKPVGDRFLATAGITFGRRGPRSEDVLEVGDAAGMIAPVCGDGMAMALRSAESGEASVTRALAGVPWADVQAAHRAAWRREFGSRLRTGAVVQSLLLASLGPEALVGAARLLPGVAHALMRATRDGARARAAEGLLERLA